MQQQAWQQQAVKQEMPQQPGQNLASREFTIGLLVEGECIGRVVGKQGAGLKQIRTSTGCQLKVDASNGDPTGARRVTISGTPTVLGAAMNNVLVKVFGDTNNAPAAVTVQIPLESAGLVAGKAGANLKRMRDTYNVRTELERETINDPQYGAERKLNMMGPWSSMGPALVMALGGGIPKGAASMPGVKTSTMRGADVRKLSADPEEIQFHMVVPDKFVGALLGKQGSEIKMLEATTGCKVAVSKKDYGERHMICIGKLIPCFTALKALQDALVAAAAPVGVDVSNTTIIFYIKSGAIGIVVGKGGQQVKEIREATGTKVNVEREEINGQRPCIISGLHDQVMQAINMVHARLATSFEGEVTDGVGGKRPASPDGMTAKRPRMEGGMTKLLVPAAKAGLIIGKQGSGLAQLRQSCNVHLEVLQAQQTPHFFGDRVVTVQGSLQNRFLAAVAVLQTVYHLDLTAIELKMLVPNAKAGSVVGRQGSNLKMIREQSGVNVQLHKEDIMGERLITAGGSLESIQGVAQWIMQILEGQEHAAQVSY